MNRFCRPIMTKPKPAQAKSPTPTENPPPPPQSTEPPQPESHEKSAEDFQDGNVDGPSAASEPMDTDKSEGSPNPA